MFHKRQYDDTIEVKDPIDFILNKHSNVEQHLVNKYVGRCFKGCYIMKIIKLVEISPCNIINTNISAKGSIDVRFNAEVYVCSVGDMIVGVEIKSTDPYVVGSLDGEINISVSIESSNISNALNVGNIVACKVIKAIHEPMYKQINAYCELLTCETSSKSYSIEGVLDSSDISKVITMIKNMENEFEYRNNLNIEALMIIESIYYSYKTSEVSPEVEINTLQDGLLWKGPEILIDKVVDITNINIFEIIKQVISGESYDMTGIWSRDISLYRSSPMISKANNVSKLPQSWIEPTKVTPITMINLMLMHMIDWLVVVRKLCSIYSDPDMVATNINVFKVLKFSQLK